MSRLDGQITPHPLFGQRVRIVGATHAEHGQHGTIVHALEHGVMVALAAKGSQDVEPGCVCFVEWPALQFACLDELDVVVERWKVSTFGRPS